MDYSIRCRGEKHIPSHFMLQKPELSAALMDHLPRKQTLPLFVVMDLVMDFIFSVTLTVILSSIIAVTTVGQTQQAWPHFMACVQKTPLESSR